MQYFLPNFMSEYDKHNMANFNGGYRKRLNCVGEIKCNFTQK